MATGGRKEQTQTLSKGSNTADDYACTYCIRNHGLFSSATNYCPDCDVYYCRPCLQYSCQHGSFGKAKLDRWGRTTSRKSGEQCTDHTDNMIQLYCGGHNEVGCHICMAEHHNRCTRIEYIADLVSKKQAKEKIKSDVREIVKMKTALSQASMSSVTKKFALETAYCDLKKEMRDFRRKINDILDDLEKQSMAELDALKKTLNHQIDGSYQTCNRLENKVDSLLNKLQQSNIDETRRFIRLNKNHDVIEESRKVVAGLADSVDDANPLPYQFRTDIEICLKSCNGLLNIGITAPKPYSVQKCSSFDVKHDDDISADRLNFLFKDKDRPAHYITGMCQVADGSFVISDSRQSCVKHIDASYNVIDRCGLRDRPGSLCCMDEQEIAIAMYKKVQFVSVGSKMKPTRSFEMALDCYDLAYNDGKLYLTCFGSSIFVYNVLGIYERAIKFDEPLSIYSGIKCTGYASCVCVYGDTKYIACPTKNDLFTLDKNGQVFNRVKLTGIKVCSDMCLDGAGGVFVCGRESNNIMHIATPGDGQMAGIVFPSDGIKTPRTLCFDRINSKLLVACEYSTTIYVLDLVK